MLRLLDGTMRWMGGRKTSSLPSKTLFLSMTFFCSLPSTAVSHPTHRTTSSASSSAGSHIFFPTYRSRGTTVGDDGQAETRYRKAITLDPYFLPAQFNLATLLNTQGRNRAAEEVLREAIIRSPAEGELNFSLSLLLAEEGNIAGASQELVRAAALLPERARVHYNLGLTRQHLGDRQGAEAALLRALVLEREQPDFIYALTIFYMQDENWPQAKRYAELLRDAVPDQPAPRELLEQINQSAAKAATTGD